MVVRNYEVDISKTGAVSKTNFSIAFDKSLSYDNALRQALETGIVLADSKEGILVGVRYIGISVS